MTISDTLKSSFPKRISREDEIFSALVANSQKTGCLEKILTEASSYMKSISNAGNIYNSDIEVAEKAASFLTFLERFENESESSFFNRISAIFHRNGDDSWGTPYDIKQVFRQYFPSANIYVVESTGKLSDGIDNENMMLDYDFQTEDVWETDCEYSIEARFSGEQGIKTSSGSFCKQSVEVDAEKAYMLHFFIDGNIKVEIKNNNNKYWDSTEYYDEDSEAWKLGKWVSDETYTEFSSNEWKDKCIAFITDDETSEIEINFVGVDESYIDYVRLFEKHDFPTFTVVAQFTGETVQGALGLAKGTSDPVEGTTDPSDNFYKNAGYYNGTFLTGVSTGFAMDIYEDLLDYIRSGGVKAYLEILIKDN